MALPYFIMGESFFVFVMLSEVETSPWGIVQGDSSLHSE